MPIQPPFPQKPTDEEIRDLFIDVAPPAPNTYEIGLVLGGTSSAGAYTAGVIDFLVEALDEWTSRRDAQNPDPKAPPHKTLVKLITGTSGGGVTAGVLARALAFDFPHVTRATDPALQKTGNPLYDLWVNNVNLTAFLGTSDIDAKKYAALLDGDVLDAAANTGAAFTGASWRQRSWIAAPLRLITTVTNLSGIPYTTGFSAAAAGTGESFVNHADYARFAVFYPKQAFSQPRPDELVLGFESQRFVQAVDWPGFTEYAKATSAFPLGFPARALVRPMDQYRWRVAVLPGDGTNANPTRVVPLTPDWSQLAGGGALPPDYHFLAVDGGATDNEPLELARTSLAGILGRNSRDAKLANRGVLLVDPFAGGAGLGPADSQTLPQVIWPIVNGLIQQTRYDTADILLALDENVFSRFLIAPISAGLTGEKAITSAGFGAFIGFACRAFMRYDYLLGRANAQAYLKNEFVLAHDNPVFGTWPQTLKDDPDYKVVDENGDEFLPIIPLMGTARITETLDPWPKGQLNPESYRDLIEKRFQALVQYEGSGGLLSGIATWAIGHLGQKTVADLIINAMNSALIDWKLK